MGWIGVDFDGTLARYDGWMGTFHFGEPLVPMVERIRRWLENGIEVRIFTARVAVEDNFEKQMIVEAIQSWLEFKCKLPRLAVTNVKDFKMTQLWDDRAVQVIPNTGEPVSHMMDIR